MDQFDISVHARCYVDVNMVAGVEILDILVARETRRKKKTRIAEDAESKRDQH